MKYQVGDIVLILHSNEEGQIVDFINDKMAMVEVRGVRFPVYMDQIDFPYFKRFTEQKKTPVKTKKYVDDLKKEKPSAGLKVADGVWLTFLPVMDIYSVIGAKAQNDRETWYMIDSSFITTLPDTWGIGEKFLMLPINKWDSDYQRVVLGGITCDSHDYYDSEEHINEVFLPKINNGEPLYVGFFHTGAYQDQISGYGGIKHCLIPSPKHIIVDYDKNGKLVDWVYAKQQTAQSMLKILGYDK